MRKKFLPFLLYSLPVFFFIISYFLIVTSGEDIWQGASTPVSIVPDALAAFRHSVRLADMFAWAVINFFDYIYSFGIDTLFRLLDVAAAFLIFYLSTYLVLRRRPRLRLSDAIIFSALFLSVFLTSNGLTLYAGFSKIHNYLFICFFTLLFGIPYLRDLWGLPPHPFKHLSKPFFAFLMLLLGFLFGFASNVTAIVFLLTLPFYALYHYFSLKNTSKSSSKSSKSLSNPSKTLSKPLSPRTFVFSNLKSFIFSWRFCGILGILLSIALMYLVGNGLGDYDTNPAYLAVCDYLPFSDIFQNLPLSALRILKHNLYNFARFLFPFLLASIPIFFYLCFTKNLPLLKNLKKSLNFSKTDRNFLVASGIFIFFHIFALSQIYYPTRLVLPAYLLAASVFLWFLKRLFSSIFQKNPKISLKTSSKSSKSLSNPSKTLSKPCHPQTFLLIASSLCLVLTISILALRTYFAVTYLQKVAPVFEEIKTSPESSLCVPQETAFSPSLPYIHLGQEDFLVDWAMPQTIYGKTITYCE
ncbi:hypothetical protein IKF63_02690 [Candidatus Saccharibacteria bacterium]|nr:hypothetical protein [Candidatus Saccharibacteria bacterium]